MVSCMKLVIFYSMITFLYTKYFVHSYTINVVFNLSYQIYVDTFDLFIYIPQDYFFGTDWTILIEFWFAACSLRFLNMI